VVQHITRRPSLYHPAPQSRPTSARSTHEACVPLAAAYCNALQAARPSCQCRQSCLCADVARSGICGGHHRPAPDDARRRARVRARRSAPLSAAARLAIAAAQRRAEWPGSSLARTICLLPEDAAPPLLAAVPLSSVSKTSSPPRYVQHPAAAYAPRLCRWIVASIVRTSFSACEAGHLRQSRLACKACGSPTQDCVHMGGDSRSAACAASAPWVPVPS
jgi:hypothetical protein